MLYLGMKHKTQDDLAVKVCNEFAMNLCFVFDDPNALCVVHLLWLLYYLVRKVIA